jgi:hypothetical protein
LAGAGLRLVHRGVRYAGLEGGQGAVGKFIIDQFGRLNDPRMESKMGVHNADCKDALSIKLVLGHHLDIDEQRAARKLQIQLARPVRLAAPPTAHRHGR